MYEVGLTYSKLINVFRSFINVVFIYFVGDDSIETEMKLLFRYPGIQVEFMLSYAYLTIPLVV